MTPSGTPDRAARPAIDVRLLGGVDVLVGSRPAALKGVRPRAILAYLAMQPGQVVPTNRIIDGVWGGDSPASARSSLQVHISGLRRSLRAVGLDALIETRPGGYAFVGEPALVDVHRFEANHRAARRAMTEADLDGALRAAAAARRAWRGSPLAGLGDVPFAASWIVALEEQQATLVELHADISIALGRPAEVVAELEQLVAAAPYRETAWARLGLALYRSGRQADALARLRTVRHLLATEVQAVPSDEIVALEQAILQHDPALGGVPTPAPAASESRLPAGRPLVGREALVTGVVDALSQSRLVCLTGTGGVGKTAVAIAVGHRLAASGSMSARFVDLAQVDSTEGVAATVEAAVGTAPGSVERGAAAARALGLLDHPLLVLDNCEHVLAGVREVAGVLLDLCPQLRILATSRERLGVASETVIACVPLPRRAAAELFVARAQAADRDYVATGPEAAAVDELVARLDCLPLAIEIFASRTAALSAVDMAADAAGATMLAAQSPVGGRHRSLADTVAWSYNLLDASEQRWLRRMSVFATSASAGAIAAVCGPEHPDLLERLVRGSLVVAEAGPAGVRYRLLATVRAFLADRLAGDDADRSSARAAFVEHMASSARELRAGLEGPEPAAMIAAIDADASNISAAVDVALAAGHHRLAARLLAALGPHAPWASAAAAAQFAPRASEALGWADVATADRIVLLMVAARSGGLDPSAREACIAEALALAGEVGDRTALADAWAVASVVRLADQTASLEAGLTAIELAAELDRPVTLASALCYVAQVLLRRWDRTEFETLYARHTAGGTARFGIYEPTVMMTLAHWAILVGDLDEAAARAARALAAAQRTGTMYGFAGAWYVAAEVARYRGDVRRADELYQLTMASGAVHEPAELAMGRMMLIWTACLLGDISRAQRLAADLQRERVAEAAAGGGDTVLAAAVVTVEALLALAQGLAAVAREKLLAATAGWIRLGASEIAADLLQRLPEALDPGHVLVDQLHAAGPALRVGAIPLRDAERLVGLLAAE